jgi:hypothetical protein
LQTALFACAGLTPLEAEVKRLTWLRAWLEEELLTRIEGHEPHWGRALINAQPNSNCCQLDEGEIEIVGCELVVAGRDPTTLLEALSTLHHVIDLEWMKEAYRLSESRGGGLGNPHVWAVRGLVL